MRSSRRRKSNFIPEITLTPLIDTALTLLVIFMITTPIMKNSLKVSSPEVKNNMDKINKKRNRLTSDMVFKLVFIYFNYK